MADEVKPVEKSLSYMAWSVKEMAESLKKIATMMTDYMAHVTKNEAKLDEMIAKQADQRKEWINRPKQEEIPF
jgi:hypothetical protein